MSEIEILDKIERYSNKEMLPDEKRAFQQELLNNQDIKEYFEAWLLLKRAGIETKHRQEIAASRRVVEKKKPTAKIFTLNRVLAIAASFLGVFIMVYYQEDIKTFIKPSDNVEVTTSPRQNPADTTNKDVAIEVKIPNNGFDKDPTPDSKKVLPKTNDKVQTNEQLAFAQNNYPKLDEELNTQTLGSSSEDNLQTAKENYKNGKYAEVILQLEGKATKKNELLLLAEAHFREKNYSKAEYILKNSTISKYDDTDWRLLMVYLAQSPNKKQEFNMLLEKIKMDKNHKYNENANKLKIND